MITGGDLRQSRLDVGYKTFTISPCYDYQGLGSPVSAYSRQKLISSLMAQILQWFVKNELFLHYNLILTMIRAG